MKKNILITISLLLIIIKAADKDACTTLASKVACEGGNNCVWTAGSCGGDTGAVCSAVKSSTTCQTTTYETGTATACTYKAESTTGSCTKPAGADDSLQCSDSAASKADCANGCTWTPTNAASCEGGASCTSVQDLSTGTACEGTTYTPTANCAWNAQVGGSCATKATEKEENEEEEDKTDGDKTGGSKTGGSGTGTGNGNGSGSGSDSSFGLKLSGLIYLLLALF